MSSTLAPGLTIRRHLHRGRALDVYEVWSEERSCSCVAKALRPDRRDDEAATRRLLREGRALERLSHPHIVRVYETIAGPPPVVVLETVPGRTLGRMLVDAENGLDAKDVLYLGLHLASAISYLHCHELLHLDMKPSNVISDCGRAKVIDLSVARPPGRAAKGVGTARYMSPEQALGVPLDERADSWGIGVVLFEAATGRPAFAKPAPGERHEQLERRVDPVGEQTALPLELASLIDQCLEPEAARRPAPADLVAALRALAG